METLNQYFERQVAQTPDATALVFKDLAISYAELNQRANRIAAVLREQGVGQEHMVAILMDRSIEMIVATLGVIKSGGAYVPIDPSYPSERISLMLRETEATVLVSQSRFLAQLPPIPGSVLEIESGWGSESDVDYPDPVDLNTSESLAYVMYTSGSTGFPKGVMVPHRGILRLVRDANYVTLGPDSTVLQLAPVSFDASTFEIWGPLLNGGRCVLYPKNGPPDNCELKTIVNECGVNTIWLTASLFNSIVAESPETLAGIEQILTGGEALSVDHIKIAQQELPETKLINGYGPTETTTFASAYSIPNPIPDDLSSIPIGYAINNTELYVLGEDMEPVPAGAEGELFVGGHGVALGYLRQPELTAERFVSDPFSKDSEARLYRTGDRVIAASDGCLEFLGRKDDQVKLRGYRIEPGEIEHVLRSHDGVGDAKVLVQADEFGQKRLVAYLTNDGNQSLSTSELRHFLGRRLPEYMIPSRIAVVDEFPLTANGKLDREKLRELDRKRPQINEHYQAPRNKVEMWLADIWKEILGLDKVGIRDPFFELGGDSLRAARFINKIKADLNISLPLVTIYDCFSIERFARMLETNFGPAVARELNLSPEAMSQTASSALHDDRVARRQLASERRRSRISRGR